MGGKKGGGSSSSFSFSDDRPPIGRGQFKAIWPPAAASAVE